VIFADLRIAVFRVLLSLATLWCAGGGFGSSARADDLSDFEAARARYDRHDYARAVEAFRALVGSDPPRISNALLVLESRKYYAASLLFRGASDEARVQFRMLLQQEPDYALDPLAFPTEVVALFDDVKAALRGDLERKREAERKRQREEEEQARSSERLRLRNLARLRSLAETQQTRIENSRWLATIPFGIGQFQNGHRALGVALAMGETLAAATSVVSYLGVQGIDPTPSKTDEQRQEQNRQIWRTINIASFSTFAALAVIGIVDAHVRFVPARVTATPRPLPLDLDRWVQEQALRLTGPRRF
jgi:hypothetical protein